MSLFKQKINQARQLENSLKPHGLTLMFGDTIMDMTLPEVMFRNVCKVDLDELELSENFDARTIDDVANWVDGERTARIEKFKTEQREAHESKPGNQVRSPAP
ncbi:hypothetical protein AB6D11_18745 [Vibrio splendidus]